jgi:hypothetical protein
VACRDDFSLGLDTKNTACFDTLSRQWFAKGKSMAPGTHGCAFCGRLGGLSILSGDWSPNRCPKSPQWNTTREFRDSCSHLKSSVLACQRQGKICSQALSVCGGASGRQFKSTMTETESAVPSLNQVAFSAFASNFAFFARRLISLFDRGLSGSSTTGSELIEAFLLRLSAPLSACAGSLGFWTTGF